MAGSKDPAVFVLRGYLAAIAPRSPPFILGPAKALVRHSATAKTGAVLIAAIPSDSDLHCGLACASDCRPGEWGDSSLS